MTTAGTPQEFHFFTVPSPARAPRSGIRFLWTWECVSLGGTTTQATFESFEAAVEDATGHGFEERALPRGRTALDLVRYGPAAAWPQA